MKILSLGAGVQSTVLALMAAKGELGSVDCAIFADTQWEPKAVYRHLDWLEQEILRNPFPFKIYRVSAGNIKRDLLKGVNTTGHKFITVPLFNKCGNTVQMGRRQCTREYKLSPLYREARRLAGFAPRQRIPKHYIQMFIGITTDEIIRMKDARVQYIQNCYPLVDADLSRQKCLQWFRQNYPNRPLVKSACIGCPFRTKSEWLWLKNNSQKEWREAVKVDKRVRNIKAGSEQYLHNSAIPLTEAINQDTTSEISLVTHECEGMCGI